MQNILTIDTSDNKVIHIGLKTDKQYFQIDSNPTPLKSQIILILIDKLLKQQKLDINQITNIEVYLGPGSFTGLRVGVSVANTFGFALKIPINGKKVGDLVEPLYNK
jgi:tRNA threonylcarbamoyladenosine biosynthesis protein TsaB